MLGIRRALYAARRGLPLPPPLARGLLSGPAPALLIKNGTVVNADRQFRADVCIRDGKIVSVRELAAGSVGLAAGAADEAMSDSSVRVIDATGKYVIPGGIDPHVHLEMPFMGTTSVDGYLAGTRAAVAGGTTTLVSRQQALGYML
jgi:dihydropyrimidinase